MSLGPDGKRPRGVPGLAPPKLGPKGKKKDRSETEKHAKEVREVIRGKDIVERPAAAHERLPPTFDTQDLMAVRSWMKQRPFESNVSAAALVHFPRQWSTRRGRYCRFQAPGAGVYGVLRARPSF